MVEPQIVVLVVAGSSPVGHPISEIRGQRPEIKSQISDSQDLFVGLGDK